MDSSSSAPGRRRLEHDATNVTQQGRYPAHDDAMTSLAPPVSTSLYMAHYVQTWRHTKKKYITYYNVTREGPSHGHK